jgi:hypothetical protein
VGEIADGNQGIEMVQFGRCICCLKLYEGERSERKKKVDIQDIKWCNLFDLIVV